MQVSFLDGMATANQWCVPDEMHDVLSVDFDRSLTGMEVDFCNTPNAPSSSVFAVPEITLRKEDIRDGDSEKIESKRIRYSQLTDVKRFCFNKEMERTDNLQTRCRSQSEHRHFYSSGINSILSAPFHCILLAPTAISTKINEETLTYLNQGQPYEVKIKKTGTPSLEKSFLFKSVVRVGFQERRLQYMEKEQIIEWQSQRYNERIVEIDRPLSYGILEATNNLTNECAFSWDSNYDVGVFLKINCISTEFTPKKHGGEKGVPFRILIETYCEGEKLHSASCQIKVFKPKGADRKHKTDKEKMTKRSDKEKYHPQFEYTVFRDLALSDISSVSSSSSLQNSDKKECFPQATSTTESVPQKSSHNISVIKHESSADDCSLWLQANKFANYLKDFENFCGKDLLSLNRNDLIDICGTANGIRLFNGLHRKGYLTTYVRLPSQKAYSAIYLKTSKTCELFSKIKNICGLSSDYSCEFYASGPGNTRVVITDEVVNNMIQDSLFVIECSEGTCDAQFYVYLRQVMY